MQSRFLNRLHGTAMVIGSMFGIGIFLYPPLVAKYTESFSVFIAAWLLGGLISLLGALSYSELGVLFPKAGGDYTFHKNILGDSTGFASGWLLFLGIFSGSIATMTSALVFFQLSSLLDWNFSYILWSYPWGGTLTLAEFSAVIIILLFSVSNSISIRLSGNLQIILTFIPVTLVLCLCVYGLFTFEPQYPNPENIPVTESHFDFVKAYLLVYFAYAGWNAVVYFSGDFENPRRDVPFSLLFGTGATTLFYFILGAAFVYVLGFTGLQNVPEAGTAIAGVLGGTKAKIVMTGLIASAILASLNGTILAGGKIGYAMARDGTLGFRLSTDHRPAFWQNAIFGAQALWSILLILTGGFEALTELTSLAMLVTAGLSMIALFIIRKKTDIQNQLYRFKGFMLAPWIFFIINLGILMVSIQTALVKMRLEDENSWKAWYSLLGIIIFVVLWLSHIAWTRIKNKSVEHPTSS